MTRVEIDGLALNVELAGEGPPVVLLHGFTGAAAGWGPVVELLTPEFTTIAIDIVGHGQSDAPPEVDRYAMERCANDLVAAVRSLGHERAAWLGYSMGGRTALQLATLRPDAVSALVLEGATPGLIGKDRIARMIPDQLHITIDLALEQSTELGGVYDDTAATGPDALFGGRVPETAATATRTLAITWGSTRT